MVRATRYVLLGLIFALAIVPCTALAQITTGTINGTVKDSQGGVVPGATVSLISDSTNVQRAEVTTDATGGFVIPNVTADTYTVQVTLQGFKTLRTSGIRLSPGDRLALPAFVLEVGTLTETVQVTGETPLIQASSGERSFSVSTEAVQNLPVFSRNFLDLAVFTPGVRYDGSMAGVGRIGGGGYANIQMDGISAMDTGNNGQMIPMNVETVAEVKVLTTAYQAEYGRSSGIQILSVTRGGTNRFRGSVYDIERSDQWNTNSKANKLNGVAKSYMRQRDWGFSAGGPVGKPGGNNKLFFFYSMEFRPRTGGGSEQNFRLPTALERQGDFSQSRDNNGNLYPYIRDYTLNLPCNANNTSGCFQYQGVLGRIDPARSYAPGVALLNAIPMMPNYDQQNPYSYNTKILSPKISTLSYQPATRVDYQVTPAFRVAFKWNLENQNSGIRDQYGITGVGCGNAIPEWCSSKGNQKPWRQTMSISGNYNIGSRTFLEVLWGRAQNFITGPPTGKLSNRFTAGIAGIPDIYTTNRTVDPKYWTFGALNSLVAPFWVNGKIELPQNMSYGGRASNAQGTPRYPGWLNVNQTWDVAGSVTQVWGRHTLKGGINLNHSFKAQNQTQGVEVMGSLNFGESTNNPYDPQYGYAGTYLGLFQTYSQASKFVEVGIVYLGIEPFIQDNWKVNSRLTLDYGLRFVHLIPEHDKYNQMSNFFPDQYQPGQAPALYVSACPPGTSAPCANTRQAMNPLTGALLGPGTSGLIGQRVIGTGNLTNGIKQQGQGISKYNFEYPALEIGPRVGVAYLLRPDGKLIARGGFGMFFDRVEGNFTMSQGSNPPTAESTTLYYGDLRNVGGPGATSSGGVPSLNTYRYKNPNLPTALTYNAGIQWEMPYAFTIDASYVGQYSYDTMGAQGWTDPTNLNQIDIGAAYLPQNQDPTLSSTTPGGAAYVSNLMRPYRGYGNINEVRAIFSRTSHSLQVSVNRRFNRGFSAGLNWNWVISDKGNFGLVPRMQVVNNQLQYRPDWDAYQKLNEDMGTPHHYFKGNFVWDLPDWHPEGGAKAISYIINDWQLSGVWTAGTGGGYGIGFSYNSNGGNTNITGSPDYGGATIINGATGSGCSSNQYKQFETSAFSGASYGATGMESGRNYMHACWSSIWDMAIARNFPLGGTRNIQFRVETYNTFNLAYVTGRSTNIQYNNPVDKVIQNPQYNADGTLNQARILPRNAGFGAVSGWSSPLTLQLQLRFQF